MTTKPDSTPTVTVLIAAGIPPGVCLYLSDRIRGLP